MLTSVRPFVRTLFISVPAAAALFAAPAALAEDFNFPGLKDTVTVYEDALGIPTIKGSSFEDVVFVQGYLQARDRFFQMDFFRKTAAGRLGELVGSPALPSDVELRTLGLARAALASWQVYDAEMKGVMQAFANGVNAWLATNPLPPEYGVLELTGTDPWTPLDSISYGKLLSLSLSFELDIDATVDALTYQAVGQVVGFNGAALFSEDTYRSQPTDGRVTLPGFLAGIGGIGQSGKEPNAAGEIEKVPGPQAMFKDPDATLRLAKSVQDRFSKVPLLREAMRPLERDKGSNEWAVSGAHTDSGYPLIANDPHLQMNTPAIWHESNMVIDDGEETLSVSGVTFTGAPGITLGCNDRICWGATVHDIDDSDVFRDAVLVNALGAPTHTVHSGVAEPIQQVYQSFFVNIVGDAELDNLVRAPVGIDAGGISNVVPRRNNGPVLALDPASLTVLTSQYTGWGPTTDLQAFYEINQARNMDEFKEALQYFDVGSQNFIYADIDGNIGYFTSAENPIRSDMAAGTIDGGVPPMLIRDGTGTLNHEWLPVTNPQPNQSLRYEILPYEEMPQAANPARGYLANANNDPIGVTLDNNPYNQLRPGANGLYYLNFGYADFRQGRVDRVLKELVDSGVPITPQDMMELQANDELLDAELTLPTLLNVMAGVPVPPGSPMAQALDVLSTWDYSSPTGLAEGWDAGDDPNMAVPPDAQEVRHAAAATVFAMWRSMLVQNTIDATLTAIGLGGNLPPARTAHRAFAYHLLNYDTNDGVGASGINFFSAGLAATVAGSLQQALDLLASDEFAPAFANSTNVMDYAWGKLHRIVFDHPLNADPFNIPNGYGFMDLAPDLPGLARQGGFEVVDASSHSARADGLNEFMFGGGPSRRFVGEMTPDGVVGYNVIPGGQSGVFFNQNYGSQLPLWLTNSYHELPVGEQDGIDSAIFMHTFNPVQ